MPSLKILLTILPPFWPKMPPIGLGFLESFLAQNGIEVHTLDLNNAFYNLSDTLLKKEWLISCNVALEKNILSLVKKNHPKQYEAYIQQLLEFDAVGFSCFKSNLKATLQIVRFLKSQRKDIKIILGGPEITRQFFKGKGCLKAECVLLADFCVVGEGEKPLLRYLKGSQRVKTKIAQFEELESLRGLPFPTYKGLNIQSYPGKDTLPLQFSRGCIRKCSFCSERLLYRRFRMREVSSVIEEMQYHRENNQTSAFVFFDSLINADLAALEDLCGMIIARFGRLAWEAQIAIRDDMKEPLLKKMRQSGCYNLFVGLESGSDTTLKKMRKSFSARQALNFFRKLNYAGLSFGVSMIVGYPGETEVDFKESLDFIIGNKELIPKIEQVNPFVYYDGTDAGRSAEYTVNKQALRRLEIFVREMKQHRFKYTNAFLGNLVEKHGRVL